VWRFADPPCPGAACQSPSPATPSRDGFLRLADEHAIKDHAPRALHSPAPNQAIYQAKRQH
jgi:hypothetical protein